MEEIYCKVCGRGLMKRDSAWEYWYNQKNLKPLACWRCTYCCRSVFDVPPEKKYL